MSATQHSTEQCTAVLQHQRRLSTVLFPSTLATLFVGRNFITHTHHTASCVFTYYGDILHNGPCKLGRGSASASVSGSPSQLLSSPFSVFSLLILSCTDGRQTALGSRRESSVMAAFDDQVPPDCGRRLQPTVIDARATEEPDKPWASLPFDDYDLSKGFEDISYATLATAIDKMAWFIEGQIGKSSTFETIAYLGVSDIRYHIIEVDCALSRQDTHVRPRVLNMVADGCMQDGTQSPLFIFAEQFPCACLTHAADQLHNSAVRQRGACA